MTVELWLQLGLDFSLDPDKYALPCPLTSLTNYSFSPFHIETNTGMEFPLTVLDYAAEHWPSYAEEAGM